MIKTHTAHSMQPIERLIPYARNSRTHSNDQIAQIMASLAEFGFTNPVLIDDAGGIVAGHGRVMAAKKLGMAEVPCITLSGLSDAQKRAYVIADNKLALNAGWDLSMLSDEITRLLADAGDVVIGFTDDEINNLLDARTMQEAIDITDTLIYAPDRQKNKDGAAEQKKKLCPTCGRAI
jgi:ParB-like chromosome segregation protein Spo0J